MSDKLVESAVGMRRKTRRGAAAVPVLMAVGLASTPYPARRAAARALGPNVVVFGTAGWRFSVSAANRQGQEAKGRIP